MPPRLPMVLSIIVEPTTSAEGNQQSAKAAPVFRSHFLASHSHDTFLNFPFSHGHRGGTVGAGGGSNVVTLVTDRRLLRLHEKHLRVCVWSHSFPASGAIDLKTTSLCLIMVEWRAGAKMGCRASRLQGSPL